MRNPGSSVELVADDFYANRELFCDHCLRIAPKEGGVLIPFVFKKEQRRLAATVDAIRATGRPPKVVILKGRRIGFSTWVEAELFRECWGRPNKQALVVAHRTESADAIFKMSKRFYDNLPPGLQPPTKYETKKLINFAHNGSQMQVEAAGESRAFTAQYLHISELAFIPDADRIMAALLHTAPDSPESLVVAESTPNGIGNYFHNLWTNAVQGRNDWVPFFSPWFEDETYVARPWFTVEELSEHDRALMEKHDLTLEQMAWYVYTRENKLNGDQDLMDQENASDPKTCFLVSGRKVFDPSGLRHYVDTLDEIERSGNLPARVELDVDKDGRREPLISVNPRGRWRIYRPPARRCIYLVGADIGSGDPGGDFTPLVVMNRHTLDVDAVFYSRVPPEVLAHYAHMIARWYNDAMIVGEANNHGILFFDELTRRIQWPHIYYRQVSAESVAREIGDKPGVQTSGDNRTGLTNLPRRYVRNRLGKIEDPDLLNEFQGLFYDDRGRVDHPKNGYMDGTMALAFVLLAHSGSTDATLAPLPLESLSKAPALALERRMRQSMGQDVDDVDLGEMTVAEIERFDLMLAKREKTRERAGLGGEQ